MIFHFHGEKNGKKTGKMLFIVVKSVGHQVKRNREKKLVERTSYLSNLSEIFL